MAVYKYDDAENNRIAIIDSKENTRTEFVTNTNTSLSQVLIEKEYKLDDDGNIIDTDTDNENPSTTIYIHGLGLIAQENEEGGYLTYHYDHLGSTTAITDETGKVIHTYTYGPYGELLSRDAKNIRFLYNGMYGVSTDSNGLYYMRARYYNVDIKRFISQDILTGSISNSPSLNRYSYVQGNPISLTDPFGLSPDISWSGIGHAALDLLGCVPVVGFAFDLANAAWYCSEGDFFGVTTSLISAVPGFGSAVGNGLKWGAKGSKKLMLVGDLIINGTKMIGHGATFVRGTYGVAVSGGRIVTDIRDEKDVNFWDVVQFGLNSLTVTISGKGMVTSAGATIDNVKGLNELRVSNVGACFVAGTLISTEEGLRPIEEINIGDYVWAENPETNEKELKRVVNTFINAKDEIVHLHTNVEEIETTREHPFYVEGKGFVKAEELEIGDEFRLQSGKKVILASIWYEDLDEPIYVYNFEVEDFHTYYVGESSVLVHNKAMVRKGAKITRKNKGGSQAKVNTGRGKNNIIPDTNAQGGHSVYKRDPNNGKITNYKTYEPNPKNPSGFDEVIGYDGVGKSHKNPVTGEDLMPHIHDKSVPGKVRAPRLDEIPK